MATIEDRPFSKNYSGLINQSVIGAALFVVCVTSHDYMKKKRRRVQGCRQDELGRVESWQFGYLYQARSWAWKASPPIAQGWPLSWVKQVLRISDRELNKLRGVDAALYVRILTGCVWFTLAHTFTTFPILFPIHVTFSNPDVPSKSMTRASISSLVDTANGPSLLWIHLLLLIWITISWFATLHWITRGAFRYRTQKIQESARAAARRSKVSNFTGRSQNADYHPHPHLHYAFQALPPVTTDEDRLKNRGLRVRTIMVANIPPSLRSETQLKEYFEYYLSRPIAKPTIGVTSSAQPGFVDRMLAFVFNRAIRLASRMHKSSSMGEMTDHEVPMSPEAKQDENLPAPVIEKVVIVRKMTELVSLLERREDVLCSLEAAHIKLARNALHAVGEHLESKSQTHHIRDAASRISFGLARTRVKVPSDLEGGATGTEEGTTEGSVDGEDRMTLLARTLMPFLPVPESTARRQWLWGKGGPGMEMQSPTIPPSSKSQKSPLLDEDVTVWDALLSLPRSVLDTYQPLIHLSSLFRGKTVPAIDYYTAKLNLLTSLITEQRAQSANNYAPMSTAFVTFADPADARRACKYLAVHPNNPVNVCLVSMAPSYEDLDWKRLMKSTFRVEFVKDWVVNAGVWAFTIFWVFPVTSIVAFVSIQTIGTYWPGLKHYLDRHEWQSEVLQSLVPTLLVSLLALLVPLLLLLIAKKAHTISTLSSLHDKIMSRYYKFLIVNVLVFFCVGTVTLQTVLTKATTEQALIQAVAESFPTAAPFYVSWLILTTALHGCLELPLFGLPMILYPSTKRQITPRKRFEGVKPRTFNYYYWLPSHLLIIHILLLFAVLNPLVIPFGLLYFCVETVVIKNQLLHVYAKNYEQNGQNILIRFIRYSLDGLILSQAVFLAYMVVLKVKANVGVAAVLIILTTLGKLSLTRFCRAKFERDDALEANILCGLSHSDSNLEAEVDPQDEPEYDDGTPIPSDASPSMSRMNFLPWKFTSRVGLSYGTIARRHHNHRPPLPFGARGSGDSVVPLHQCSSTAGLLRKGSILTDHALPILTDQPITEEPHEMPMVHAENNIPISLVHRHPPLPTWDDNPDPDFPYDNPYYTGQISETLWLPRSPLGILDLDDTVDMRISLTSDPSAGQLGAWAEEEFAGGALTSVFASSVSSVDEFGAATFGRSLDGSETISLPPAIASRIDGFNREHDVATARRPSFLTPRRTSTASTGRITTMHRRTVDLAGPSTGFRSFSMGAATDTDLPRAAQSLLTVPAGHRRQRSASTGLVGLQRPNESGRATPTQPFLRPTLSSIAQGSVISTHEAVVGEAIAEEQEAAEERQRQEEAKEVKAKEPRSWLTAWMFSKHD